MIRLWKGFFFNKDKYWLFSGNDSIGLKVYVNKGRIVFMI